mgnify:CR=1 FL=1
MRTHPVPDAILRYTRRHRDTHSLWAGSVGNVSLDVSRASPQSVHVCMAVGFIEGKRQPLNPFPTLVLRLTVSYYSTAGLAALLSYASQCTLSLTLHLLYA